MADYCSKCFEKLDAFHFCAESDSVKNLAASGDDLWETNQSIINFVIFAPVMGVFLDFILPLPSSLIHSLIISILGSALAAILWVTIKYQGEKTFKFYLLNIKNFLYTPNILKIFGSGGNKKAASYWLGIVAFATVIQLLIFTPGNSTYLANQVVNKIDKASGANLKVDCPKTKLYLYNERIECRVKTGILGITVPARANLSPFLGTSEIKISLI
jgi:hypothetical protein